MAATGSSLTSRCAVDNVCDETCGVYDALPTFMERYGLVKVPVVLLGVLGCGLLTGWADAIMMER